MKPQVMDVDVNTGESTVREMTDAEFQVYLKDKADAEARANSQK
jgi:hypothetical protein